MTVILMHCTSPVHEKVHPLQEQLRAPASLLLNLKRLSFHPLKLRGEIT